ncbi:M23 family metallopeptidase [Dechloromonas sp. CZR5]|uniref:M23 family metallopeptidase n=1 Tax=Dechloromonas sp. CZR5 TaxID=2608630 RepID=UPI001CC60D7A|nr:M23 family metallopeptidase [Dechloromonas sp. CZR5]
MQIILVSRHLKAARTITIMPRHVLATVFALLVLVFSTSALFSWLSVALRLPLVEDLLVTLHLQEDRKTRDHVDSNLQLMATRLGELQAQVLQLDALGERLSGLAGVKRERRADTLKAAQGGPYVPVSMSAGDLQKEIERLAALVDRRSDDLAQVEFKLLEKRVRDRLLPTVLPVKDGYLGSPFGHRADPIMGVRAMHEGIDFNAETGTPVVAAADGVVLVAAYHPEFGNMIDIDHGEGLVSRYAHLSRIDIKPASLVKRGQSIGAVGNTGRSTGAHLHFEVRMQGVAQNPAHFLKQGEEYAHLKRR